MRQEKEGNGRSIYPPPRCRPNETRQVGLQRSKAGGALIERVLAQKQNPSRMMDGWDGPRVDGQTVRRRKCARAKGKQGQEEKETADKTRQDKTGQLAPGKTERRCE